MALDLPIVIDGAESEGGGQLLRTSLSLAAVTGHPFTVTRFRAERKKIGLRPRHLEVVRAMAGLCDATVDGAEEGSERITFAPRRAVQPAAELAIDLGTAGAATLLLQTLCWPLALAGGPSRLTLRGGTHFDHAPTFHDLALVWAPMMARLGFPIELGLQAAGFYPEGGGEFTARIEPARPMPPLDLRHRGTLRDVEVVAMVGGLGYEVAVAQADHALRALRGLGIAGEAERLPLPVRGSRGTHVLLVASFERSRSGHGAVRSGEAFGAGPFEAAVDRLRRHLERGGAIDPRLADQLLLPAALLAAGRVPPPPGVIPATRFTTSEVTSHLLANAAVVRRFLEVEISVLGRLGEEGEVRVQPPGSGLEVLPLAEPNRPDAAR
jgi:RNA 3'-terminal phosphate cyclase (ATP)